MGHIHPRRLNGAEKAEVWRRWRQGESEPTTQRPQVLRIVMRHGGQGRRTARLSAESAVVRRHELRSGGAEPSQLCLVCVMFDRRPSSEEHWRRHSPQSAVPRAKRVQGHVEEFGKLVLREIGGTTQFAQFIHREHTMPSQTGSVKRLPAY
jgi:hypothetical protein